MNPIKKNVFNNVIPLLGSMTKGKNKFINVIYYHDIVNGEGNGSQQTNIELFKSQIKYIKDNGYKTFTFDELEDKDNIKYNPKTVLITFDDGWVSNYSEIFEYMKKMNIKYNIFLECKKIGNDENYLTWDMVREMHASGIVGFGAHTFNHPDMSDIENINTDIEIIEANKKITEETGIIPKDFCYPFGKWSEKSNKYLVENTGYTRIYTSSMRYSYLQNDKIIFGRSSINSLFSFKVFKNMVKGNYNIFSSLRGLL